MTHLETIVQKLDEQNEVRKNLLESEDERDERAEARKTAENYIRNYAHSKLSNIKGYNAKPETLQIDHAKQVASDTSAVAGLEAEREFGKNLEATVGELKEEHLGKLARTKNIRDLASDDEKQVLDKFARYANYKEFVGKYLEKDLDELNDDEKKAVIGAAVIGAEKTQRDALSGSSEQIRKLMAGVARIAVLGGYVDKDSLREYAKAGINEQAEKLRAEYEKSGSAYDIVKRTLTNLAKKDREGILNAMQLTVGTYKDNSENTDEDKASE